MRRVAAAVVIVLGVAMGGRAQGPPASPAGFAAPAMVLRQAVADGAIAGAVAAVSRAGRTVFREAVGVQDLQTRAPMTERTLFRIYSMTKPVTAVAVMQYFEEGRFRLDDPVAKYLPEFRDVRVIADPAQAGAVQAAGPELATRPAARPVTVEDLLLHTSGLSHRTSDLYRALQVRSRADTLPEFVRKITRAPLMEDPGTRYRYSEATTVLGRLVEVWSGMPLDRALEARVLGPLGMTDTRFWVGPADRARLATVYGPGDGPGLTPVEIESVPFTDRPALLEGAVGLVSTVPDFMRFALMLLNEGTLDGARILKPETVRRIVGNGLPPAILAARGGKMGWGLGNVNVVLDPSGVNYPARAGEYGWDGTAGTIFWNDPATKTAIVLMTQSAPANPGGIRQRFKTAVEDAQR